MKKFLAIFIGLTAAQKVIAFVGIACGIIVLAGGILIYIELRNYCKKHGLDGHTDTPPVAIPPTNAPGTNSLARFYLVDASHGRPAMRISDEFIEYTDISGYYTARDTDNLPFTTELKFRVSTGPSPAGPWTVYCATGWGSSANLLICFYSNGVPIKTNYGGLKNAGAILLGPTNAASLFYKFEAP